MLANAIDKPSVLRRSVGLAALSGPQNPGGRQLMESGEEDKRALAPRASQSALMQHVHLVAEDRYVSTEAIYVLNNYERTVEAQIFITACVQHSFVVLFLGDEALVVSL